MLPAHLASEYAVHYAAYEAGKNARESNYDVTAAWRGAEGIFQLRENQIYHRIKDQVRKEFVKGYLGK